MDEDILQKKILLSNLKNFDAWSHKNYPLREDEALIIVDVLEKDLKGQKEVK